MSQDVLVKESQLRMTCIDYATRVVGKPFLDRDNKLIMPEDLIKVADKIYKFVQAE